MDPYLLLAFKNIFLFIKLAKCLRIHVWIGVLKLHKSIDQVPHYEPINVYWNEEYCLWTYISKWGILLRENGPYQCRSPCQEYFVAFFREGLQNLSLCSVLMAFELNRAKSTLTLDIAFCGRLNTVRWKCWNKECCSYSASQSNQEFDAMNTNARNVMLFRSTFVILCRLNVPLYKT